METVATQLSDITPQPLAYMPIHPSIATHRITQEEFKHIAFEVMEHVFTIHNEFGRFFDEKIYKRELANRLGGVQLEVAVDVTHETFTKRYLADVLVRGSGLFEFKAADAIHERHIGQEINYLLLFDLAHGKSSTCDQSGCSRISSTPSTTR